MSEIKRTGPPAARDVRGDHYVWTLPLNQMPGREWKQFFGDTRDVSIVCSPWKITIYQGQMVFESAAADLVIWIKFIDKWMAMANSRWAAWAAEQRRLGEKVDTRDRDQKLLEVNERFKNL